MADMTLVLNLEADVKKFAEKLEGGFKKAFHVPEMQGGGKGGAAAANPFKLALEPLIKELAVLKIIEEVAQDVISIIQVIAKLVSLIFRPIVNLLIPLLMPLIWMLTPLVRLVWMFMRPFQKAMMNFLKENKKEAVGGLAAGAVIGTMLGGPIGGMIGALVGAFVVPAVGALVSWLGTIDFGSLFSGLVTGIIGVAMWVGQQLWDMLPKEIQDVMTWVWTKLEDLWAFFEEFKLDPMGTVGKKLEELYTWIDSNVKDPIVDWIKEQTGLDLVAFWDTTVVPMWDKLVTFWDSTLKVQLLFMINEVFDVIDKMMEIVESWPTFDDIIAAIKGMFRGTVDTLSENETIAGVGSWLGENLVEPISQGIADLISPTATGGIVTSPQIRKVGEAGPEAIIPLDKLGMFGGGSQIVVPVYGGVDWKTLGMMESRLRTVLASERRRMARGYG